ncbi:MAG: hypothetical protein LIP05_14120 [Tannerellaceae bacterium]|nr:hypothetical protein [Tannerellaceae bacterium]MCC8197811.1 hypothetical protein [Tannerellaceae bacterium]
MMIYLSLCLISLPEIGVIIWVAVLLFGWKAISQNPILTKSQKLLWIATILVLNWIGLLWYYYIYYIKNDGSR